MVKGTAAAFILGVFLAAACAPSSRQLSADTSIGRSDTDSPHAASDNPGSAATPGDATASAQPSPKDPPACTEAESPSSTHPSAPEGLAGFRLGTSFHDVNATCERAEKEHGVKRARANRAPTDRLDCTYLPSPVGMEGETVHLGLCQGRLCEIEVVAEQQNPRDSDAWRRQVALVLRDLEQKYGAPDCLTEQHQRGHDYEARWAWRGTPAETKGVIMFEARSFDRRPGEFAMTFFLKYVNAEGAKAIRNRNRTRL